jgi:predicted MPP superfamily phosphohydrolase
MRYTVEISVFRDIARAATKAAGLGVGDIDVHAETLELPAWPEALSGLRIAVIADLHTGSPQVDPERIERIVDRVNAESVDLVGLLGDYIDTNVALSEWIAPETIAARLGRLESWLGTYAVLGNHDWAHAGARMAKALRDAGITLLENEAVAVAGSGTPAVGASGPDFWIAGLGDLMRRTADLEGTLAQVPAGEPVLLFSHNGAHYTGGHIEEGGRHLYVGDGIGTSRLPIRLRAKPELPVLELRASSSASH